MKPMIKDMDINKNYPSDSNFTAKNDSIRLLFRNTIRTLEKIHGYKEGSMHK